MRVRCVYTCKIYGTRLKDFKVGSSNSTVSKSYYYLGAWNVNCMRVVLGGSITS